MRKLLLSLLLATTAVTPAFAQRADREDRTEAREERRAKAEAARKERVDREAASTAREAARPERAERPERVERPQRAERVERNVGARDRAVTARERQVERRATNVNERGRPALEDRRQAREAATNVRQQRDDIRQQREDVRQQRQDSRSAYIDRVNQRRVAPPRGARPDRPAPPPVAVSNTTRAPTWHTTWRHDDRYDWRRWRDHNRSHFRLGFYFDPFGWGYQRWGVGWRLWPSYYSDQYWLNDPWSYRLPYAPWPYRWVRYYDDAMLVNTMNGQVADVIYDFFW